VIQHAAELWAALAVCFLSGCLAGSLIHRTVGLTGAARLQGRLVHLIDRGIRIVEWRLLPWRYGGPVPLPTVVPVPPPDYRHAEPVAPAAPIEWGEGESHSATPSLEGGLGRSLFDAEDLREAVDRADLVGTRPAVLGGPRLGQPDDLTAIAGLGKRNAKKLGRIGIYHFSQIAAWTPQEAAWIAAFLGVGDTMRQRDWIGRATRVAGSDDPAAEAASPPRKPPKARARRGRTKKEAAGEDAAPASAEGAATAPGDIIDASVADGVDAIEKSNDS
jgi:predicted flap endonuclease-1-like 5' DNA nuclease